MCNNDSTSSTLNGCTFENNTADQYGGAFYAITDSDMVLTNCLISANTALMGGGMFCDQHSNTVMTSCTLESNHGSDGGGGMYGNYFSNSTLTDCQLLNNSTNGVGGAIFNIQCNSLISGSVICGSGQQPIEGEWTDDGGNTLLDLCLIGDEDKDGIDDSVDNCYLYNPDQTDCNGNEVGDVCDVADGTSTDWNDNDIPDDCECLADINADGIVNVNDLLIVIGNWDSSGIGDINADGIVDVSDLLIVVGNWGPCE